jgi:hypothetical protein
MKCLTCGHDPESLQARIEEVRNRLIETAAVQVWGLNGRHWYQFVPGQVIEITDEELQAVNTGATLESILEARREY